MYEGGFAMFKKLIATAVSLVLCLATLCACRSYDEFYFDELVFLDVWIGHSGEPGKDHFVGEQLISSVEEYVDFCIRWDINLAGGYRGRAHGKFKRNHASMRL